MGGHPRRHGCWHLRLGPRTGGVQLGPARCGLGHRLRRAPRTRGEPIYGERDTVDLGALRDLGLPFWLAGGVGSPEALGAALATGAAGIQVGTLFAFCDESGLDPTLRRAVLTSARAGSLEVFTDPLASPTGYPFKTVTLGEAASDDGVARTRLCDLGYLRAAYRRPDGRVGYRCPGEPVDAYLAKGGDESETIGRRCLCNALLANAGRGQLRPDGTTEAPLITAGDQARALGSFLAGRESYTANDVLGYLLAGVVPS